MGSSFKIGTEPAIAPDREIPRDWRFEREEDEQKLLNASRCDEAGVPISYTSKIPGHT